MQRAKGCQRREGLFVDFSHSTTKQMGRILSVVIMQSPSKHAITATSQSCIAIKMARGFHEATKARIGGFARRPLLTRVEMFPKMIMTSSMVGTLFLLLSFVASSHLFFASVSKWRRRPTLCPYSISTKGSTVDITYSPHSWVVNSS